MAEEIENEDDQGIEEEEEDNRETDDRQNLDDLTVLNEDDQDLDDPEGLQQDDDQSDWEEPLASNSLSAIHTGSQPTEAELLANLAPEGETIIEEGEILQTTEVAGQPLPEVDAPEDDIPDPEPDPETGAAGDDQPLPAAATTDDVLTPEQILEEEVAQREAAEEGPVEETQEPAAAVVPPAPLVTDPPVLVVDPEDDDDPEPEPEPEPEVDPEVEATDASGDEDTAIALTIDPAGATEIVIGNVPAGATLSNGIDNEDGTWTLTDVQLDGLTITPPSDSDTDFTLLVTADGVSVDLDVTVDAVADAPTAEAENVTGQEDTAIELDLSTALSDIDASESLSVTISGMPEGATLSAGVDNEDGTWTVDSGDIASLTITPPADFVGDIPLTLSSTSTEADGGDSATTEVPFTVTVTDTVDAENAVTQEDTSVSLTIDPGAASEVVISDVPDGATFSAGVQNDDGTWTVQAADLDGLSLTPPADSDADFTLTITGDGFSETMDVSVEAVADTPTVGATDEVGSQDTPVPLDLSAGLTDTDGSEALSIELSGIPDGAVVSVDGVGLTATNGAVSLTADQLANVSITPAEGFFGEFDLQLTSTATDTDQDSGNTDVATNSTTFTVTVNEAGEFTVTPSEGLEDTAIGISIDPGDATTVTIENLPDGAMLSAGTEVDGVWTIDAADLAGLTVTPPADSDVDFTLSVTADGVSQDLVVTVNADADAPTANAQDVSGVEDMAILLNLESALTDTDLSETLSITITDVPDGAVFSSGTNNEDGTWTIDPADLDGLTVTPPANFYGEMSLGLTATSTETDGGDSETTSVPFTVTVASDGDFGTSDATGTEDTAIALDIDVTNIDGTEIVISDVPEGAVLNVGTENEDGTWTVPVNAVGDLEITPPADSDADFVLTITADGASEPLAVTVIADADAPSATAADVVGEEDTPVGLDLASALTDTDGSETLSITISDVPTGASFSAGTDNGDGTWTIDPSDLADLSITPPLNYEGDMDLTLNSTSTESDGGDTETTSVPFTVTFTPDPDEPNFVVVGAEGDEDTAIPLEIDPGTASEVIISNIPDGAAFSAGTDNGDGTWTILADDLDGLTVTPPEDSDVDFTLSVSATDADGVTAVGNLDVAVHAVADAPDLDVTSSIGLEDASIPLDITSALNDADGSETLSMNIDIQGVPDGSVLSAGTQNEDGTWTLTQEDLTGLTITPPDDYYGDMTLQVTSTATESNPSEAGDVSVSSATSTATFGVTVRPVADDPELNLVDAVGSEDTVIALNISANMGADTTEDLATLNISGVPDGATLSGGTDLGNGIWSFSSEELAGGALDNLTITPAEDYNGEFTLTVSTFSTDGGVAVQQMNVDVEAVSDLGITETASGIEDNAIALDITAAANEDVTITGLPDGAVLSAGTENEDGSWSLTAADLDGLTVTPPANSDTDFSLSVYAGDSDGTPDGTIAVSVAADADVPTLDLTAAAGSEDNAIALDIDPGLGDADGSETLSISIGDIPTGSSLSYVDDQGATQSIAIDGTSATLTSDQLNGLTITPPDNFDGSFDLSVSATATEAADGTEFEVTSGTMTVDVAAVADQADVTTVDASGTEDGAIALNIGASGDDDISSITIADVPDGAVLSAGTLNDDGTWTLAPDDLAGLEITPAENSDTDFVLSVTATTTDGDDTAVSDPASLTVSVAADADVPTLDLSAAAGSEDTAIALDIDPGLTDGDGSESLSISIGDIPAGSSLNYVDDQGASQSITIDGTSATLTTDQLNGLTITPPDNFDGSFDLSVSATSTEADGGDFEVTSGTMTVDVASVADDASVSTQEAFGTEDQPIALSITTESDDDITSVVISGVPDGAVLSAGVENDDGTWTLSADDLANLTVTPPADSSEEFQLSVAVTTTDGDDTNTSTGTLDVNVAGDADAPSLNLFTASGDEDAAISLQINAGLSDTDGSETLSITISDIPAGATLNNGQLIATDPDTGAQTWSLEQDDLSGLTITPAADSSDDFDLNVAVTATEADGDTSTTTGTLSVGVDGVADTPTLDLSAPASGTEDTAIPLTIDAGLADGSESLSVTISNIPDGASLSYVDADGITQPLDVTNGSADLSAEQLSGLAITPPADSADDFQLSVVATSTDGDDQATKGGVLDVSVAGDADTPTLNLSDVSGAEDTAIALNIDSALTDTDGSETLSVTISDVPTGASLSAGVDNEDGTWTLTADDLDGLTMTPPTDFDGTINLSVTSTATEADGDTASTSTQTLSVTVTDDNVGPAANADNFGGSEDGQITFTTDQLLANDTDGNNDTLTITDFDQPANGTLTSDGSGNFTFTPDENWSGETNFTYTISDGEGGTSQATVTLDVDGVADAPVISDSTTGGNEDTAIALNLDPTLTDTDGSETLSISIGDIPTGATLSFVNDQNVAEEITVTNGTADLTPEQLNGLTITPPENDNSTINLSVTSTATEADGGEASTTSTLTVDVAAVNDGPEAVDDTLGGTEDQAFTFTAEQLLANDTDVDGDTLTVQSVDQPEFGTIVDNGNGTFTFTPDENWSGQTDFTYTATDGEGGTSQGTVTVNIGEMNEGPVAADDTLSGNEDSAITFFPADLLANDTDGDGDSLTITGFDQPDNGAIVENPDGSYTFTPDANWSGQTDFSYTISDGEGGTSQASVVIDVDGIADAPDMTDTTVGGNEDSAIALNIDPGLTDTDGSESLSITVGDIPAGATLNYVDGAGVTQAITVTDGSATLEQDQLNGLTITPPENSNETIDLSISATTTEDDGGSATTDTTLTVDVAAVNDGPVAVDDVLTGSEDQAFTFTADQLLANDTDVDGDTLTVQSVDQPDFGTIVDNGNGTFTFTPDENWSGQTDFTYTSTDGEGGTSQGTVTVDIGDVNDGPVAGDDALSASEDQPLTFSAADLLANDSHSDGDSLSITGFDQPDNGTIVDNLDGTFTFTPDANWSGDTNFSYTVSDGEGGTSQGNVSIGVDGVADAPNVTMADVTGNEDSAITLNIDPSLVDTDGSESLSLSIGDIPAGATLEYVDGNGDLQSIAVTDGSADISSEQLNGLQITPTDNFDGTFDLSVTATSTEGDATGDTAVTTGTLTVDVAADADAATLTLGAATGTEDTAIPLSIGVTADDDISTVTISGVPNGATLTYEDELGATQTLTVTDNSVSLTPDQLSGLEITPPANSDEDFALAVSATTTDGGDSETVSGTLNVSVDPEADAPSLNIADVTGVEDSAIALNIDPSLVDADGSESLSITVGDIPAGATMSYVDGNGDTQPLTVTNNSVDLTTDQLNGLTITPVDNFDGTFDLSVAATSTEADGGDAATTLGTLTVDVTADADNATLTLADVSGTEDTAIPLNIEVTADDNIATVTIADVPAGASLSAGVDNGDGTWTLNEDQVDGLTLTPPADSDGDFTLTVSAMTTDGEYSTTVEGTMDVSVAADADAPTLTLFDSAGNEDAAISLNIASALTDTDGSEDLSVTLGNIPDGATLNYVDGDGVTQEITVDGTTAELPSGDLSSLTITPPENFDGSFDLSVTATSTEGDALGDTATTTGSITVDVAAVADEAELTLGDVGGTEDQAISLNIGVTADDDISNVTISGIPEGASLNSGALVSTDPETGEQTWTVDAADVGGLTLTPAADSDEDFTLGVSATTTDGADSATVSGTMDVSVAADADAPTLTLFDSAGNEDAAISLNIASALTDTDGSEDLSVTLGNIPDGATLNYVDGDGVTQEITVDGTTAELPSGDLSSLTITPPENFDGSFDLSVTATSTEGDALGDTATTTGSITVDVAAVADEAELTLGDVGGTEDQAISLNIGVTADDDISNVTISGIPEGASLNSGALVSTDPETGEQTWTVDAADVGGLSLTPAADSDEDFTLGVSATTTDGSDSATVSGTMDVSVAADADAPTLTLFDSAGNEDAAISLNIASALTDTDGSEDLSVTLGNIPDGATLNYVDGDGVTQEITVDGTTAELPSGDLSSLTITPPENFDGSFDLSVTATSTEGDALGDTATTTGSITVDVAAVADEAELTLGDVGGTEDQAISLNIGVTADDDISNVTISGIPEGASLNSGALVSTDPETGEQTWTVDAADVGGLTLTPAADSDEDFTLGVSATTTDGSDSATVSGTMDVSVAADADAPTLTVVDGAGDEDTAIALNIDPGLTDAYGSESLSITIGDIPPGSTLNYLDDNENVQEIVVTDGSAELTADQLNGLTITPAQDFDGSFDLSVTATSTEGEGGDSESTSGTLTVDVAAVDDSVAGSTLETAEASGDEDTAIALDIDVTQLDTDGSETVSITITDVPTGAVLSNGTANEDGSWTLDADDLNGLTITPSEDSNDNFTLGISVTTTETEGGESTTTEASLDVDVAGVADAPTAIVQDESGSEDSWIQMNLDSSLSDTDGSETLSITISDVPEGALLAPGTDNGDGTWTVSADELPDVCILPADNFDGEITMTLNVTSTENDGDSSTTSQSFTVTVEADADAANLNLGDVSGTEDEAISLNIGVSADDDIANVTLTDIPDGSTLNYVDGNGITQEITVDGTTAELSTDQLNGLTITPPENSDDNFTLGVSATTTDGDDSTTVNGTMDVSVAADADAPTLTMTGASGDEDTAIALNIDPGLTDADGSESLSITVGDIPAGSTLNYVDGNGITQEITVTDGAADLSADQLNGLTITPADNFDGSFDLSVTATSTEGEGGDAATTSGTLTVDVAADADEATLSLGDVSGTEDEAISLNIGVTADDDIANVTLSDIPDGSTLSYVDGNGVTQEITVDGTTAELSTDQLNGLTITPPENSDDNFTLGVSATTTDGSDSTTVNSSLNVTVAADADGPTLAVELGDGVVTTENGTETDVSITSSNFSDTDSGFTITARNIDGDGTMSEASVDNVSTGGGGIGVGGSASASGPDYQMGYDQSSEQSEELIVDFDNAVTEISFDFGKAYANEGGSGADEQGHYEIYRDGEKVGEGDFVADGGHTGSVTVTADDGGAFDQIVFSASDGYDETGSGSGDGSDYVITGIDFTNVEGGDSVVTYPLDITSSLTDTDGSETLSITIDGLPDGAVLSAGSENENGSWTLDADDITDLEITVSGDNPGQPFELSVVATATEGDGGDTSSVTVYADSTGTVVDSTADGATVTVADVSGTEDNAIALDIDVSLLDTDGSETASITLSGMPEGAELSAGTENQDGTWTLEAGDLDGLTVTPAADSDATFELSVSVTTTEENGGETSTSVGSFEVSVAADADAPTLTMTGASGDEDTAIALNIDPGLTDTDGSESLSITVGDIPAGATLNYVDGNGDTQSITVDGTTAELSTDQLNGLTITPADNFDGSFDLSVTATSTEGEGGDTATTSGTLTVDVAADADEASLTLGDVTGTEDQAISLNIDVAADDDIASITLSGVPSGSTLNYVDGNGDTQSITVDGTTAELSTDQLNGLTITPPENSDDNFTLGVSATTTDGDDSATVNGSMDVTVAADADTPTLTVTGAAGDEDTAIALNIDPGLTDTDGSESLSITVGDIPAGSTLNYVDGNGDTQSITVDGTTAELSTDQLNGLTITPAQDFDGSFDLSITATSTEGEGGDTATTSGTLTVDVAAVDDSVAGSTLETTTASGDEDTAIALDIDVTQLDADGSETVSISLSQIPSGATLNYVDDNGVTQEITIDGTTADLTPDQLNGLTVTPPADSDTNFTLDVSVTTTEQNGGESTTTATTLDVDVAGIADAPTLSASVELTGVETAETDVNVPQAITDVADGNTITVSGVPNGATLSAGTDNGDGSWTLASGDLADLTVTPIEGSTDDIALSFEVVSEGASGESLFTDNFDNGVSGWGNEAAAEDGEMYIGWDASDESATRSFDFGEEHAGQTVTISFDTEAWSGWDESGDYQDYLRVSVNDTEVYTSSEGDATTHTMTVTLDENGQIDLDIMADTTTSSEGFWIDDFSIETGDDWSSTLASETVDVTPEAGGGIFDLDITSALTDSTSETLSITVTGLPDDAELSAGVENPAGTWTLDSGDLVDLTMTVPSGSAEFNLQVAATATEDDGGHTNTVQTSVTIEAIDMTVEGSDLSTTDASGSEDTAIALDIDVTQLDVDGSETASITLTQIPSGATLSYVDGDGDTQSIAIDGTTAELSTEQLNGLTILPPEDSSANFQLGVSVTTTETDGGDSVTTDTTMEVTVAGVADTPELSVTLGDSVELSGGSPDPVSYWKMDETSNGNETLTDSVGDNDGTPRNTLKDMDDSGQFNTAAEFSGGGDGSSKDEYIEVSHSDDLKPDNGTLTLWFNTDDEDNGTLASSDSSGYDSGGHFNLSIDDGHLKLRMQDDDSSHTITSSGSNGSVSEDEWNQVTVSWGEDGMKMFMNGELVAEDPSYTGGLSGNDNPWTFGASQSVSGNDVASNMRDYFDGHLDDIAIYDQQLTADQIADLYDDGVQAVMDAGGDGDSVQFPLDITTSLTDASESLSITINGLPLDAELSAGTDNGDGSWTLGENDLDSLTVTVPTGTDDFAMTVSATSTDEGGDTRTATEIVPVDVADDGFDADVSGTSGADDLTGTSNADVIDAGAGNDEVDAGDGDDVVMAGAGDDTVVGGDGNDIIEGGAGNDIIDGGAGDDSAMGGDGNDLFIFGAGDGSDYFDGGNGWSDTVQIEGVDGGPGGESGWAMQVEGDIGYTETANGIEFDEEVAGSITLSDGSELTFEGVEKLEW